MANSPNQVIVAASDGPEDGYSFYGPFDTVEDAIEWAELELSNTSWWVPTLHDPREPA